MRFTRNLFFRLTILLMIVLCLLVYYFHRGVFVTQLNRFKQLVPDVIINRSKNKLDALVKPIPVSYSLENCPKTKDDMLNVHFVMHTHDDPGWLKTPDEYYDQDVREILFSVVNELNKDPKRKFVYSEMYFFKKWWTELNETTQNLVTEFVINGQLEFVGGGWVQNDDALTHYSVIIDQMSYGLNEIKKTFGLKARPAVGWQIDSFGYSKEQAALFSQLGFQAEVIQRLPWYDLDRRRENKAMEFTWRGDARSKIFTHILYDSYVAPTGFRYETDYTADNINDQNLNRKVQLMFQTAIERSKSYQTNHLMMLMGHDFVYKRAFMWFDNVDKLIEHGNGMNGTQIHLMYSTPSCYLNAVRQQLETASLPEKTDDFFPYCNNRGSMWTGFYSSRPTLKGLIQKVASMLQTVENLESAVTTVISRNLLTHMRENFFTTLHHDAITGTCKQAVADDYIRLLVKAELFGQKLLQLIHASLSDKFYSTNRVEKITTDEGDDEFCPLLNTSLCSFSQSHEKFVVTIFNGHSKSRQEYISIPVDSSKFTIFDRENNTVLYQAVEVIYDNQQMPKLKSAKYNLIVPVNLPALGFVTYNYFLKNTGDKISKNFKSKSASIEKFNYIENEFYKIIFNLTTGLMVGVENKKENKFLRLSQHFAWYENPSSGAYIFRPTTSHVLNTVNVTLKRSEGPLVQEVWQKFDNWATQIVRLYKNKNYVEVQWTVGPIFDKFSAKVSLAYISNLEVISSNGKEIVTRLITDIDNGDTFFTDANGRQLVQRHSVLPSPEPPEYPIGAAFFPLTSMISIKGTDTQFIIITDRPMGGSSLSNGSLELLLHRKVMGDDGAGMGEGLYETGPDRRPIVVRGTYRFAFATVGDSNLINNWRELAKEMFYVPILKFSDLSEVDEKLSHFTLLTDNLPAGIHLLSLQRIDEGHVIIRLENYYENRSQVVSLQSVMEVKDCSEMLLSGDVGKYSSTKLDPYAIVLEPMSIITLLCSVR